MSPNAHHIAYQVYCQTSSFPRSDRRVGLYDVTLFVAAQSVGDVEVLEVNIDANISAGHRRNVPTPPPPQTKNQSKQSDRKFVKMSKDGL